MAPRVLWRALPRWVPSDWWSLADVVLNMEDFTGDRRSKLPSELFAAWHAAVAELQQRLLTGRVRAAAHLYPEQGTPAVVALTKGLWRRFQIQGVSASAVVLNDTSANKEVRSPTDWRLFLHAGDLGRVYPLGPTAEMARDEEPIAPAAAKPPRRKPDRSRVGRPPKDDWHTVAKNYLDDCARQGKAIPNATQLLEYLDGKVDVQPSSRQVKRVIESWILSRER